MLDRLHTQAYPCTIPNEESELQHPALLMDWQLAVLMHQGMQQRQLSSLLKTPVVS